MDFPGDSDGEEFTCNAGDLGWEDPLEKGMATHSSILTWRIDRGAWQATGHGVTESDKTEQLTDFFFFMPRLYKTLIIR